MKKKKKNLDYYCYLEKSSVKNVRVLTCCVGDRNIVRVAHTFPTACNRLGNVDREEERERGIIIIKKEELYIGESNEKSAVVSS